ncbi:uncharacterized protein LOC126901817 isoform X2 [Daktulosphaira vitifoliae]|uniref:uncharacterized protein LOC126901817 isoform X2 n=1 Tax=Daktulosphaira vitifoliae TaxID=58002 RepID=UPI0021A99BF3|nr:uncharacterized protein LOC126901817 isoform X2 [Daktulosphaira vitifoliae]
MHQDVLHKSILLFWTPPLKKSETLEDQKSKARKMFNNPTHHNQMADDNDAVTQNDHRYKVQQVYDDNTNTFLQWIKRKIKITASTTIGLFFNFVY